MQAGGKCAECGYNKNISALVFHHLDEKTMALNSNNLAAASAQQVKEEINKCILLCHNCHNELHNPELSMKQVGKLFAAVDSKLMTMNEACNYFINSPEELPSGEQ